MSAGRTSAPLTLALLFGACAAAYGQAESEPVPVQARPQGAAAPAPVTAPVAPEISVVTVLGRMPRRVSPEVRRLDRTSASSCAYDSWGARDEVVDAYLDHFQGKNRLNDGTEAEMHLESDLPDNPGDRPRTSAFDDNSPFGDARRDTTSLGTVSSDGRGNPCTQAAYSEAAGRNQIARKDKTLDQAYAAYDKHDFVHALASFRVAYQRVGWDDAALMLGAMYEAGQGTPRDPAEAIAWYTRLAQARLVPQHYSVFDPAAPDRAPPRIEAELRMAQMYMAGAGVERDPARARHWFKQAADLNFVPARFTLARMFDSGYGGEQDPAAAVKLYTAAAEAGYAPAQMTLAARYQAGQGVGKDAQKAFAWYQQVALNKFAGRDKLQAQYALAQAYDQGLGVAADPARALTFYKLAAVAGHPGAQNALATYFYDGQQVAKDLPLARKLFLAAASQGNDGAMVNAAAMLYRGEGGAKDPVQALAWLKLGGKLGNEQATKGAAALENKLTPEERAKANAAVKGGKS